MFRFSLKKLLALLSILAIVLACFSYRFNRARQQYFAIQNLPPLAVEVYYDYEHSGWMDVGLDIPEHVDESPYPSRLVDWLGIDFFATINDVQMESCFEIPFDELQPFFDMGTIEQFAAGGSNLESVEIFAQLKRLKRLLLTEMPIKDISPLSDLPNLISLNLRGTSVEDVSSLKKLKKLEWLSLQNSNVKDISAIAALTKLKSLDLTLTGITDISPLSQLSDLEELDLINTGVTDLTPLSKLTKLTDLSFSPHSDQSIDDISFLNNMKNLTRLFMSRIECKDIEPVKNCKHLNRLVIYSDTVSDIEALREFNKLDSLWLSTPELSDVSAVAGHTNLTRLEIYESQIDNLTPLAELRKLKELVIHASAKSVDFIAELSELYKLEISGCSAETLPLANLVKLKELTVNNTQIRDFNMLCKVPQIVGIEISDPKVSDIVIPSLSNHLALEWFRLTNAKVKQFGTLPTLPFSDFNLEGSTFKNFDFLSQGNFDGFVAHEFQRRDRPNVGENWRHTGTQPHASH